MEIVEEVGYSMGIVLVALVAPFKEHGKRLQRIVLHN
jgi:hypothetical protein